jgi:hypothetical protein
MWVCNSLHSYCALVSGLLLTTVTLMHFFFEVEGSGVAERDAVSLGHMLECMNPQSDRSENPKSHIICSNLNN